MNNGVRVGMMNFTKLKARNKVFCATFLQKSSERGEASYIETKFSSALIVYVIGKVTRMCSGLVSIRSANSGMPASA